MALQRLQVACCVFLLTLCLALYVNAKDFSPQGAGEFEPKYEGAPWVDELDGPVAHELKAGEGAYYDQVKDDDEKRGTKNDRLRGLRRLSRLYGDLGYDNLRPVKKTPETADDMYILEDKRDAGPHAWFGTGMYGKRSEDSMTRGRWRTRSPRPQAYHAGLFGKRATPYDHGSLDINDINRLIDSLREDESRR